MQDFICLYLLNTPQNKKFLAQVFTEKTKINCCAGSWIVGTARHPYNNVRIIFNHMIIFGFLFAVILNYMTYRVLQRMVHHRYLCYLIKYWKLASQKIVHNDSFYILSSFPTIQGVSQKRDVLTYSFLKPIIL